MGGQDSDLFEYFESLLFKGMMALNKHLEEILTLVKVTSFKSSLPCFEHFSFERFVDRFKPNFYAEEDARAKVS